MNDEALRELSQRLTEMVECENGMCMHCIDLLIEARNIMQTLLPQSEREAVNG